MRVIHLFRPSTLMRAASARIMPPIPPSPPTTQGLHRTRSERSSAFRCLDVTEPSSGGFKSKLVQYIVEKSNKCIVFAVFSLHVAPESHFNLSMSTNFESSFRSQKRK